MKARIFTNEKNCNTCQVEARSKNQVRMRQPEMPINTLELMEAISTNLFHDKAKMHLIWVDC